MIPRTLVPTNVRPVDKDEVKKAGHRVTTYMDDRTVVPSGISDAPPLDGKSTIPSHLPLDVLVHRTLVPRGMAATPIERVQHVSTVTLEILDTRTVVPARIEPIKPEEIHLPERAPEMTAELREIVQPDIFTTGDANLLIEPEQDKTAKSELVRVIGSVAFHAALLLLVILAPKWLPAPKPVEIGDNLDTKWMYSPPSTPAPAPKPTPKVAVTPKTLNKVAPPEPKPPTPTPAPPKPAAELPEAPRPKVEITPQPPAAIPSTPVQPSHLEPVAPVQPNNKLILGLNPSTPGKMIDDQINRAGQESHGQAPIFSGGSPGVGGGVGMGTGVDILSDTQGVDFRDYINRLLAALKRNWIAVMPESARMGDRGVVFTTFTINPDGSVPSPDPLLERTSGKEPLDNAAMAAIHASNPFEPLPKQFHGPNLKLRIAFLYNLTPEQVGLH